MKKKKPIRYDKIWLIVFLVSFISTIAYSAYLLNDYIEDKNTLKPVPISEFRKLGYTEEEAKALNALEDIEFQYTIGKYPVGDVTFALATEEGITDEKFNRCQELLQLFPHATVEEINIMYKKRGPEEEGNIFQKDMYYIAEHRDRYFAAEDELDRDRYFDEKEYIRAVVEYVNTNADLGFYNDTREADTTKGNLTLVNRTYYVSSDYEPADLVYFEEDFGSGHLTKEALEAVTNLINACNENEGYNLLIASAYHTEEDDQNFIDETYWDWGYYDERAAEPGYSEHRLGLAVDFETDDEPYYYFDDTDEQQWLLQNCVDYGFIVRYEGRKQNVTGYENITWHYRYVGVENAKKINETGLTFDEYYEFYVR